VGTRLAACTEALTSDGSRQALIQARATDTAITRVFDVAQDLAWPARFPSRVLTNDFVSRWSGQEEGIDASARAELASAVAGDDPRIAPVDAGQAVEMITSESSVAEVIDEMCSGAEQLLTPWGAQGITARAPR
jgi:nitronate monooxygenase